MKQSTITRFFKKQNNDTQYLKKEIEIDWDEADNCHGEAREASSNVPKEGIVKVAKVVLERLPESIIRKYTNKKKASSTRKQNADIAESHLDIFAKCHNCKKLFKNKNSLTTHLSHCAKERDLKCTYCSYKTKYKINLGVHMSKIHPGGKRRGQKQLDTDTKFKRFCEKCKKISEALCPHECEKCFGKLLYECKVCAKQFKTHSLADYHYYTRCGVKGFFNCSKCDFKSVWRSKVVEHMKRVHSISDNSQEFENIEWISVKGSSEIDQSKKNECPKCLKTMKNSIKLTKHILFCGGSDDLINLNKEGKNSKKVHDDDESNQMKCSSCGMEFDHIYSLNQHTRGCKNQQLMVKLANDSDVEVVDTDEDLPSKPLISADERYERYTKMIVRFCSKCDEDSPIEEKCRGIGSKVPCKKCNTILLLKCKKCFKEYDKFVNIQRHLDTICNPQEEFKCTKCNYKAYHQYLVKGHYKSVHGTLNAKCKKCGSKFKSNDYLNRHMRRCGVEAKFQCDHCPFKSKLKIYLRKHIFRSHMEPVVIDRNEAIKMSWKRFSRSQIHLKARCKKCKKEQTLGHRLKTCKKCKTKLYYICKTCKKNYDVDDESACDHVKGYLETIKFECKRCGRGAISEKSLWMHEYKCGTKASFKCRFCDYASNMKGNTKKHEKVRHPHEV